MNKQEKLSSTVFAIPGTEETGEEEYLLDYDDYAEEFIEKPKENRYSEKALKLIKKRTIGREALLNADRLN